MPETNSFLFISFFSHNKNKGLFFLTCVVLLSTHFIKVVNNTTQPQGLLSSGSVVTVAQRRRHYLHYLSFATQHDVGHVRWLPRAGNPA